jgi:hypothetical protein
MPAVADPLLPEPMDGDPDDRLVLRAGLAQAVVHP